MGGSSIHYAAALERMPESDFAGLPDSATPVGPWPVSYQEFLPYYQAAETLFRASIVSREVALQRMSEWDRALMDQMRKNGLHPEPLHVAIRYDEKCKEFIGTIFARQCKADALAA
jgi:choline dehydrogenase-like flavoprotein